MPYKDPKKRKEYQHQQYLKNWKKIKARSKNWKKTHKKQDRFLKDRWAKANPKKVRETRRKYHQRRKLKVLIHYGGNPPKCVCCGESHIEFLTIDHYNIKIDKKHRSGDNLYGWIIRNNFPEGFRVLCLNCNFAIGHYGRCPHEDEKI